MKNSVRLLALFLGILMLAAVFASCGAKTTEAPMTDDDDDDYPEDYPEQIKGLNFADDNTPREIRFLVAEGDSKAWARSIDVDPDEDREYNVNAAVIERNTNVEKELGVEIVIKKTVYMGAVVEEMQEIFASSLDIYDIVSGYQYHSIRETIGDTAGCYLNYNALSPAESRVNVNAPYWDKNTYEALSYKDHAYWLTGDLSQAWVGTMYVSFVNKRIWGLYKDQIKAITGYSDIYDVVSNGKWTMDTLIELSKLCYVEKDGNGKPSEGDQLGYATLEGSAACLEVDALAAGCNVNYVKWVDGVPKIDVYNDHNVEFANKLYTLTKESNAFVSSGATDDIIPRTLFTKGNILCVVYWLNSVEEPAFTEMLDDYYIIPLPLLNEEQFASAGYTTNVHDGISVYGIPWTCPDVTAVTATLEAMGYWSLKLTTPAYYEVALKNRYTRDPDSAAMIDLIRKGIYSDFGALWSSRLSNITWYFRDNCDARNIASGLKSKQKSWQTMLNNLMNDLDASLSIER